jgi:omega-hydroxy-beta-dihydromenaquinone-9 sulfotransferase
LKRIFLIFFLFTALSLVELINWTCLILDHLFYLSFKKVNPKPPVFIIGMPRSATTLCYSLLSADYQNFTCMKLWEILFAPSIIQKKLALLIRKADVKLNNPLYKCLKRFDRFLLRGIEDIHPVSLFNYEEDEFLFLHVFSTAFLGFLFPKNKRILSFQQFDESLKESEKRWLMRYYRNCVKRHLFVFGPEKRYLAKSASYSPKIMSILQFFPESQFIYMLRDPLYTIASTASLFRRINELFHSEMRMDDIISRILSTADYWYSYPLVTCKSLLGKSVFIMPYHTLTSSGTKAIRQFYSQIGQDLSREFSNFLNQSETAMKGYQSKNIYTPEEFGLSEESIKKRYDFVYRKYEFDAIHLHSKQNKMKELSGSNIMRNINPN